MEWRLLGEGGRVGQTADWAFTFHIIVLATAWIEYAWLCLRRRLDWIAFMFDHVAQCRDATFTLTIGSTA